MLHASHNKSDTWTCCMSVWVPDKLNAVLNQPFIFGVPWKQNIAFRAGHITWQVMHTGWQTDAVEAYSDTKIIVIPEAKRQDRVVGIIKGKARPVSQNDAHTCGGSYVYPESTRRKTIDHIVYKDGQQVPELGTDLFCEVSGRHKKQWTCPVRGLFINPIEHWSSVFNAQLGL